MDLVHECTFNAILKPPLPIGPGPIGTRMYYEVTGGEMIGDRLRGTLLGGGEWALIGRTLSAADELESVSTWMFSEVDLHAFRDHLALKTLTIKDAPHLESLAGVGGLPNLEVLKIIGARRIHDIDEVGELSASLHELEFEACPRIAALDAVESLVGLRFLGISESGDIASLAPIGTLAQLETFYAWGSTRILDGDLSPLERLPRPGDRTVRQCPPPARGPPRRTFRSSPKSGPARSSTRSTTPPLSAPTRP